MSTHSVRSVLLVLAIIIISSVAMAAGLKTTFGKVELGNVPIGVEYSMRKDAKFPLIVESKNEFEIKLKVEAVVPQSGELEEGYEAIPDVRWIKIEKELFDVEPFGKAETDIVISVPLDDKYAGKKYQVSIWSHTLGESVAMGMNSKLLIIVANESTGTKSK